MARNVKRKSNLVKRTIMLCKEASIIRMLIVYFFIEIVGLVYTTVIYVKCFAATWNQECC